MTNGDKIRSMTDEELVEWFMSMIYDCDCNAFPCEKYCGNGCDEAWKSWIEQEADE